MGTETPRHSLHGIDIIVSYREATSERSDNLYAVLRHLDRTYTDYQLWLMEADEAPHFDWRRVNDPNVRHVFLPHRGDFPKSLLYNTGVRLSSSPVVCFHDADCIARPGYLAYCVDRMLTPEGTDAPGDGGVHAMCPFQSMFNVAGATKQAFLETPDFAILDALGEDPAQLPPDANLLYPYNVGGIFLFRRKVYTDIGGCNPVFEGWGSEDNELFARATRLGVNWQVVPKPMFHLHHDSTSRQALMEGPQGKKNFPHEHAAREMPLEELQGLAKQLSGFFA
jgi:hypothetical protein